MIPRPTLHGWPEEGCRRHERDCADALRATVRTRRRGTNPAIVAWAFGIFLLTMLTVGYVGVRILQLWRNL